MKDWRGNDVEIGSTVVYAVSFSSSVTMVEAEVVEINEDFVNAYGRKEPYLKVRRLREASGYGQAQAVEPREVKLTVPKRVVVVG